jgi:hypothetical protein
MTMLIRLSFIIAVLFLISCKKDKLPLGGLTGNTPSFTPYSFNCDTLPPPPPAGWADSTNSEYYNIRFWAYNPASKSEIIYLDYTDRLYSYNFVTKQTTFLDHDIQYFPQINAYGEVTYNKLDQSAIIVNANGTNSLVVNESVLALFPKWDYTGTFIYYKKRGICIKANKNGQRVDSSSFDLTNIAFSKTSDNYLINNNGSIFLKDINNNLQTFLFTESHGFMQPCFSKDDNYLFWWDWSSKHLHRFNMITKQRDTLLKSCENFFVTSLNISPNSDKLTMVCHRFKLIDSPTKIYREEIPIEYDLKTNKWQELHIKFK